MKAGIFPRAWARLFGERDPVTPNCASWPARARGWRLAHTSAFALLVLSYLGSLVALSGEALAQLLAGWQRGQVDVPAGISVAVSGLLVICMDVAALYGASILRVLAASTYAYMSWLYDQPETLAAWLLILARAAASPLFAMYLSLARPLPVGPRDILHGVELATGTGVLRDTVAIAADPVAPLSTKAEIFNAAATMAPPERARPEHLLDMVVTHHQTPVVVDASPALPERPPTGPGSPSVGRGTHLARSAAAAGSDTGKVLQLPRPRNPSGRRHAPMRTPAGCEPPPARPRWRRRPAPRGTLA